MADETAVMDPPEDQVSHVDTSISDSFADSTPAETSDSDFGSMLDSSADSGVPGASPVESPVAAPSDLRGILSGQGFNLEGVDDAQLANYVVETARRASEAQQYQQQLAQYQQQLQAEQQLANYGRQVYPHFDKFQAYLAQQQAAQTQPAPVPPQQSAIKAKPEYDPAWESRVKFDAEAGRYVPADQFTMPDVAEKYNRYAEWKRETAEQLINNYVPPEQLREQVLQEARQMFQQELSQWQQAQQQQQYVSKTVSELAPWVYQQQNGQVVRDAYGRPQLNEIGYAYANAVAQLEQSGVHDPQAQHNFAWAMVQSRIPQQQPAQPQQPAVDPKDAFVQRAGGPVRRPNQNASVLRADASPTIAQNPSLPYDLLIDQEYLKQTGQSLTR
jgi:hypothetical protein